MEASQDLDHEKLTSGLRNAFLIGSLHEAANYAFHGPIFKLLTFIKRALRSSEESKHRSMYRGSERTAYREKTLLQKMQKTSNSHSTVQGRVKELLLRVCGLFETDYM